MARFRLRSPVIKLVENDVELQCRQVIEYRGLHPIRLNSGRFLAPGRLCDECRSNARWITIGEPGIPDYIVPGRADSFFLETKRPGAKLEQIQEKKIWELEKIWGLRTLVIDDVDALVRWLDQNLKR